LVHGKAAFGAR